MGFIHINKMLKVGDTRIRTLKFIVAFCVTWKHICKVHCVFVQANFVFQKSLVGPTDFNSVIYSKDKTKFFFVLSIFLFTLYIYVWIKFQPRLCYVKFGALGDYVKLGCVNSVLFIHLGIYLLKWLNFFLKCEILCVTSWRVHTSFMQCALWEVFNLFYYQVRKLIIIN